MKHPRVRRALARYIRESSLVIFPARSPSRLRHAVPRSSLVPHPVASAGCLRSSPPSRRRWAWGRGPGRVPRGVRCICGGKPPRRPNRPRTRPTRRSRRSTRSSRPRSPRGWRRRRSGRPAGGPAPASGISVHKDAIHFKADMFGLDSTECTLSLASSARRSARRRTRSSSWTGTAPRTVPAPPRLRGALPPPRRRLGARGGASPGVALNPHVRDPNDPNSKLGRLTRSAGSRARLGEKRSLLGRLGRAVAPAVVETLRVYRQTRDAYVEVRDYLFPPLPPRRRTSDGGRQGQDDLCLFLSIVARRTSSPWTTAGSPTRSRRRGGGVSNGGGVRTVNPEWNETFVFNLGACKDEIEEDITICL